MKKRDKTVMWAMIVFMVGMVSMLSAKEMIVASYPEAFIPFWSQQRGGYETTLLNVNHIIRVVPIFSVEDTKSSTNRIENAIHLQVHLSDGNVIQVEEDFKEFYTRIRKAGN